MNSNNIYLNNSEIKKGIETARKLQKLGQFEDAEKKYKDLLNIYQDSYELIFSYGLLCKDLKKFILAKQLLVNLTKKFPKVINPYISIAEILKIENRLKEAEQVLFVAKNIDPNNSDLMYNFSLLYWTTKKYELSLNYINKAINLSNKRVIYKILKADILVRIGHLNKALIILDLLKTSNKDNKQIQIRNLISEIYIRDKNFTKAEDILIEMINDYKYLELGYLNLSNLYVITKELTKGINILKKGLIISPNYVPFYKNLATIYKNKGQIQKARDYHLLILKKNKFDYNSYYELSTIYDFKDHLYEFKLLLNTNLNQLILSSRIFAAFALSNILHKMKDYRKSSIYLRIANDESLKSCKSSYDLRIKNAEFFRSIKIQKPKCKKTVSSNQYIFIVGMPRSGSTLLENILSLNKNVVDMGEIDFLEESLKEINDINQVFNNYKQKRKAKFKSSEIYTDKNLFNYVYCPIIYKYFPNAKIIHCMRNPLDNILSIYRTNFINQTFSFNLNDVANLYLHHFNMMQEYKKDFGEIIFEYNYEELVSNPKLEIPKIINWLGWEWDEAYLSPHKNTRNVFTASSFQVRKRIYSSSIGIWREYKEILTPAIEIINKNISLKKRI